MMCVCVQGVERLLAFFVNLLKANHSPQIVHYNMLYFNFKSHCNEGREEDEGKEEIPKIIFEPEINKKDLAPRAKRTRLNAKPEMPIIRPKYEQVNTIWVNITRT